MLTKEQLEVLKREFDFPGAWKPWIFELIDTYSSLHYPPEGPCACGIGSCIRCTLTRMTQERDHYKERALRLGRYADCRCDPEKLEFYSDCPTHGARVKEYNDIEGLEANGVEEEK